MKDKNVILKWAKVSLLIILFTSCAAPINTKRKVDCSNMKVITIEKQLNPKASVLKTIAHDVSFPLSLEDKEQIQAMQKILYELEGVGLAAPQVGIAKRIAVIYIPENACLLRDNASKMDMHVIINPQYWPASDTVINQDFEGCYSVESVMGSIPRYSSIRVRYQNESGKFIDKIIDDAFYARVLQHEIDHLNGILITDRLTTNCVQGDYKTMLALRRKSLSKEKQKLFDELMKKKEISSADD